MPPAEPCLLTINGGSSSIEFALFETGDSLRRILKGEITRIGLPNAMFQVGIGEQAPVVRARTCAGLEFLGVELDAARNLANEGVISTTASRVAVRVTRTDEAVMIARAVYRVLGLGAKDPKEPMR